MAGVTRIDILIGTEANLIEETFFPNDYLQIIWNKMVSCVISPWLSRRCVAAIGR